MQELINFYFVYGKDIRKLTEQKANKIKANGTKANVVMEQRFGTLPQTKI